MASLLMAIVTTAAIRNRTALHRIDISRHVEGPTELWENDLIAIHLQISQSAVWPTFQIRLTENCPVTDPTTPTAQQRYFMPLLESQHPYQISYEVPLYRRGLFEFPPLFVESGAPFGLFRRRRQVTIPTRLLVYPELKPLARLRLLDKQPAARLARSKAGWGSEVLGVRPYQPGDSPRHIHWPSVARTGQLVSKEFADESQPGCALLLDHRRWPEQPWPTPSKEIPFEIAVKIAASVGDVVLRHGYPLTLLDKNAPQGAISRDGLWQYLARVVPDDSDTGATLAQVQQLFIVLILPYPDPDLLEPLRQLHENGRELMVILIEPSSFPEMMATTSATAMADTLSALGIDTHVIGFGDDWTQLI